MKYVLYLAMIFCSIQLLAQETTYDPNREEFLEKRGGLGSMVVIPFNEKMYMSDADGSIGRETGLQPGEIQVKFRNALLSALETEMSKDWNISMVSDRTENTNGLRLEFIHDAVKYNYEPISEEVLMANDTTLKKKEVKSKQSAKQRQSGIHEGQVVATSDETEKFMNLVIDNDTLMNFLGHQVNSDYYLFINEFDIRYLVKDPDKITSGGLFYRLKVHFSCVDKEGKNFLAGAATTDVASDTRNIYGIIHAAIPALTEKMSTMIRKNKLSKKG